MDFDLDHAIQKHASWKFKFHNALFTGEHLDAADIARDNHCELGKWLHGEGSLHFGTKPAFEKCLKAHAEFHHVASSVAVAINDKNKEKAEHLLGHGSEFVRISKEVGIAIVELKNEVLAATH